MVDLHVLVLYVLALHDRLLNSCDARVTVVCVVGVTCPICRGVTSLCVVGGTSLYVVDGHIPM